MSPEHSRPAGQHVPPQHESPASQQVSPQHLPADVSQQVSPQVSVASVQQVSPAQPLAGGLHGVVPHSLTRAEQTPLKQLPEQQSRFRVQLPPLFLPQL